jgi:hypothetical protein
MPRKKSDLEALCEKLEIPFCQCDPFSACPCDEPCDCPRHLKPACPHVQASDHKLSCEEWQQLLESTYGKLPHDHPHFHGEPPAPPKRMDLVTKEMRLIYMRNRDTQGFALRRPDDADPAVTDFVHRKAGLTGNNHPREVGSLGRSGNVMPGDFFDGGLEYHSFGGDDEPAVEAMEPLWEILADRAARRTCRMRS